MIDICVLHFSQVSFAKCNALFLLVQRFLAKLLSFTTTAPWPAGNARTPRRRLRPSMRAERTAIVRMARDRDRDRIGAWDRDRAQPERKGAAAPRLSGPASRPDCPKNNIGIGPGRGAETRGMQ